VALVPVDEPVLPLVEPLPVLPLVEPVPVLLGVDVDVPVSDWPRVESCPHPTIAALRATRHNAVGTLNLEDFMFLSSFRFLDRAPVLEQHVPATVTSAP
jgi:hypothetical protein